MKRCLYLLSALVLCMSLLCAFTPAARAEDCFTLNVDTLDLDRLGSDDYVSRHLTSSAQGVRVRKHVSDSSESAAHVRLTLTQMNTGTLVFDKDYGYVSHTFDSGVIYLPYAGDGTTPYLVTLYVGDLGYGLPFMHSAPEPEINEVLETNEDDWDGWIDDNNGWDDPDYGWDDNWESDASGWEG